VAGFCAVSKTLPLPQNVEVEVSTTAVEENGMNASFGEQVHCAAAEPHTTFLSISVSDDGQQVAYESVVLGRLRRGYRVFLMRSLLGTRIELCYIFVRVSFDKTQNVWATPRQNRLRASLGLDGEVAVHELRRAHSEEMERARTGQHADFKRLKQTHLDEIEALKAEFSRMQEVEETPSEEDPSAGTQLVEIEQLKRAHTEDLQQSERARLQVAEELKRERDRAEEEKRGQLEEVEALKLQVSGLQNAFATMSRDGSLSASTEQLVEMEQVKRALTEDLQQSERARLQAVEELKRERDRAEEEKRGQLEVMEALKLENSGMRNAFATMSRDGPLPERNKESERPMQVQPRETKEFQQAAALFREPASHSFSPSPSASSLAALSSSAACVPHHSSPFGMQQPASPPYTEAKQGLRSETPQHQMQMQQNAPLVAMQQLEQRLQLMEQKLHAPQAAFQPQPYPYPHGYPSPPFAYAPYSFPIGQHYHSHPAMPPSPLSPPHMLPSTASCPVAGQGHPHLHPSMGAQPGGYPQHAGFQSGALFSVATPQTPMRDYTPQQQDVMPAYSGQTQPAAGGSEEEGNKADGTQCVGQ
jgi:hypothetical protein